MSDAIDTNGHLQQKRFWPPNGFSSGHEWVALPPEYHCTRWYAVYTSANHERCVADQFALRDVEHYLPVYESVRKWKDRKVRLQLPLLPGYVFVRLPLRERLKVLQVPGVACLVGFGGRPAAISDEEVERIHKIQDLGACAMPHPFLTAGKRVRVSAGPLAGLMGILVRRKGRVRFVVSVEMIQRSVAVELDEADLAVA